MADIEVIEYFYIEQVKANWNKCEARTATAYIPVRYEQFKYIAFNLILGTD